MICNADKLSGSIMLPLPSVAQRSTALSSTAHFNGHLVIGDGSGRGAISGVAPRVIQVESHLELCWALCLSIRLDIKDLREQVAFEWFDDDGVVHIHYFDFYAVQKDGCRFACAVRPEARTGGRFGQRMRRIASQALSSGFADEVRLLTERDLNPIQLHNAWLLHAIRAGDPPADELAQQVLTDMTGTSSLADLTTLIGHGARGFRALLRLIRSGHLRPLRAEKITPKTIVYKRSNA